MEDALAAAMVGAMCITAAVLQEAVPCFQVSRTACSVLQHLC